MIRQGIFTAFLLLIAPALQADASWRQVSDDGRFVLVMIPALTLKQELENISAVKAEKIRKIRGTYATSGLYRNDGSTKPLWIVPYHHSGHDVYLSENGKYLVVFIPYWQERFVQNALYFYTNGKLVRSYDEYSGIPFANVKEFAFMIFENLFFGERYPPYRPDLSAKFDGAKHTFTITTAQYETITFDITTGKIIHHWSPWMLYTGFPLVLVPFLTWRYARRPLKHKPNRAPRRWQFSLRHTFFLMALSSVVLWLIRLSSDVNLLPTFCVIGLVGGLLGWWWGRTWNAWILGAVLSLYGVYCGGVLAANIFGHPLSRFNAWAWAVAMLASGIAGGISAGLIERRRFKKATDCFQQGR